MLTAWLLATAPVWQAVGLGQGFACLQAEDGRMACPGLKAAPPAEPLTTFAVGPDRACGLRRDGTLIRWGADGGPVPAGAFAAVEVGPDAACALRADGTAACWAAHPEGHALLERLPAGAFRQVSVGRDRLCTLDAAGALACFGTTQPRYPGRPNPFQSPGFHEIFSTGPGGTAVEWAAPALDPGPFTAVSQVGDAVCALRAEGLLRCFGDVRPPPGPFVALRGGCALDAEGVLTCFGRDPPPRLDHVGRLRTFAARGTSWLAVRTDGRLTYDAPLPRTLAGPAVAVAGGDQRFDFGDLCTLHTDGGLLCDRLLHHGPTPFVGLDRGGQPCGITADGAMHCAPSPHRALTPPDHPVRRLDTGAGATEGHDGRVRGLERANTWQSDSGAWPPSGRTWRTLPAGPSACGVLDDGRLHCTRLNARDCRDPAQPVSAERPAWPRERAPCLALPTEADYMAAEGSLGWGCGLRAGGAVVCFGAPTWPLGERDPPWPGPWTPPAGPFRALAVGALTACGLRADGRVACWGPTIEPGHHAVGRYTALGRAGTGVCGVRVDGVVACWGRR